MEEQQSFEEKKASFSHLLEIFFLQALLACGAIPNPITQETKKDLRMAKLNIDLLDLIEVKTRGNLSDEEKQALAGVLTQARLAYVHATAKPD